MVGEGRFTPQPGIHYFLTGDLSQDNSLVVRIPGVTRTHLLRLIRTLRSSDHPWYFQWLNAKAPEWSLRELSWPHTYSSDEDFGVGRWCLLKLLGAGTAQSDYPELTDFWDEVFCLNCECSAGKEAAFCFWHGKNNASLDLTEKWNKRSPVQGRFKVGGEGIWNLAVVLRCNRWRYKSC